MAIAATYDAEISNLEKQKLAQENYLKQLQANQAKQLKDQVDRQLVSYDDAYGENARQSYIQKMQSQRDLPQQLAAQGISGGLSESGNIALNTTYGNQLGAYKGERDNNAANANLAYNTSLGDLNNTYLAKLADNNAGYAQQIAAQRLAKAQAEEQARQAAQVTSSSGGSGGSGSASNDFTKRAKELYDKQGAAQAYKYLENAAEQGYISTTDFSNIAAQIGLSASDIQKFLYGQNIVSIVQGAQKNNGTKNAVINSVPLVNSGSVSSRDSMKNMRR